MFVASKEKHILLVEDNPDHAELVSRGLAEVHPSASVIHLKDGECALDFIANYPDAKRVEPDFILLDLRLPKVDGIEVLKRFKSSEHMRNIPVIILTTSNAEQDIENAYNHFANSYLVKPADFSEFLGLLKDLGHYWTERNQVLKGI